MVEFFFGILVQRENQRIAEIHSELEQMLWQTKEQSEVSRKRVTASTGLSTAPMFIRH